MTHAVTLYHNPRCSKSRQTLALLQEHGVEPHIVEYIKSPPTSAELTTLLDQLGMTARQLLRKNEAIYKELHLADTTITDPQLISAMSEHPKLIERPIVINNNQARIGRPPEAVLEIL